MRRHGLALAFASASVAFVTSLPRAQAQEPSAATPRPPPPTGALDAPGPPPPGPPPAPPGPYAVPHTAPPSVPAYGRRGESVRFEPDEPDLALMQRAGVTPVTEVTRFRHLWYFDRRLASVYAPVCEGPCTVSFAPGEYRLGVSKGGGRAVPVAPIRIDGPSVLGADYTDRSGLRTAGVVIGFAGLVGGAVMLVESFGSEKVCNADGSGCYERDHTNGGLVLGGIGVMVGSIIIGSILATQPDEARITMVPLRLGFAGPERESPLAGHAPPQGAGLELRF